MKRLLIFLALCLPIYILAQGFGSFTHDQPYFAKDRAAGTTPLTPPTDGPKFWWHAGDLADGTVNNWTDRLSGLVLTALAAPFKTNQNGYDAVYFSTHALTNLTYSFPNQDIYSARFNFMFIIAASNASPTRFIWSPADSSANLGASIGSGTDLFANLGGNLLIKSPIPNDGATLCDFIVAPMQHFGVVTNWYDGAYASDGGPTFCFDESYLQIGQTLQAANRWYEGRILDIYVSTNQVTSSVASNWHYFRTNFYGQ